MNTYPTNSAFRVSNEFKRISKGKKGELTLFRELIRALNLSGKNAVAWEIHGNRYQVKFTPNQLNNDNKTFQCELGDVLLVNYSDEAGLPLIRLSVLQIKVGTTYNSLRSPLTQWSLLSERPLIQPVKPMAQIPQDLLSNALLPSIASYGFFYPDGDEWEFDFIQAQNLIALKDIPQISKSNRSFNCIPNNSLDFITFSRVNRTLPNLNRSHDLMTFLNAVYSCAVGSPLAWPATNNVVRNWLKNILETGYSDMEDSDYREVSEIRKAMIGEVQEALSEADTEILPSIWQPKAVVMVKGSSPFNDDRYYEGYL